MTETETVEEEYMHRWRIQELGLLPNFPVMETQGLLLGAVSGGGGGDCSSTLLVLAGFATIALPLSTRSLSPPSQLINCNLQTQTNLDSFFLPSFSL